MVLQWLSINCRAGLTHYFLWKIAKLPWTDFLSPTLYVHFFVHILVMFVYNSTLMGNGFLDFHILSGKYWACDLLCDLTIRFCSESWKGYGTRVFISSQNFQQMDGISPLGNWQPVCIVHYCDLGDWSGTVIEFGSNYKGLFKSQKGRDHHYRESFTTITSRSTERYCRFSKSLILCVFH